MISAIQFSQKKQGLANVNTYLFSAAFIAGNLILPQLCHLIPNGGLILLPIFFFTLIAAYKYGLVTGLMTAILSPTINYALFGMPVAAMLPIILVKSVLLAVAAAMIAQHTRKLSLATLALVVLGYQLPGMFIEGISSNSFFAATQDVRLGLPGIILQIVGGFFLLKWLDKNGK
ncbi:MAG: ECF transporter S component [Bacteroidota bacterium]|nr:ECF transporter S component [Bacteroidota bacterium]